MEAETSAISDFWPRLLESSLEKLYHSFMCSQLYISRLFPLVRGFKKTLGSICKKITMQVCRESLDFLGQVGLKL